MCVYVGGKNTQKQLQIAGVPGCAPIIKHWASSRVRQRYAIFHKDPLVVPGLVEDIADAIRNPALLECDPDITGVEANSLLDRYRTAFEDIQKEVAAVRSQRSQQLQLPAEGEQEEPAPTKECIVCHKEVPVHCFEARPR